MIKLKSAAIIGGIVFISLSVFVTFANADVLLWEDFNATAEDIDRTVWTTPTGNAAFFGRTAIRNPFSSPTEGLPTKIKVEDGVAKLRLDTYNPTDLYGIKDTFWGSEMDTKRQFQPPSGGLVVSFEARVRSNGIPPGVVTSMFGYNLLSTNPVVRDEVDFEFLSNHYNYNIDLLKNSPQVLINYYRNEGTDSGGHPELLPVNIDFAEFNTFKMDWSENKVKWYINDNLLAARDITMPNPLDLRFNIWVPDDSFGAAFNGNLEPAQSINGDYPNQSYFYEIDWVKVSVTPEPVSSALFLLGVGALGSRSLLRKRRRA